MYARDDFVYWGFSAEGLRRLARLVGLDEVEVVDELEIDRHPRILALLRRGRLTVPCDHASRSPLRPRATLGDERPSALMDLMLLWLLRRWAADGDGSGLVVRAQHPGWMELSGQ